MGKVKDRPGLLINQSIKGLIAGFAKRKTSYAKRSLKAKQPPDELESHNPLPVNCLSVACHLMACETGPLFDSNITGAIIEANPAGTASPM